MTHKEFNHLLDTIKALPPEQMQQLRRALDRELVPHRAHAKEDAGETAYDLASRAGLIGCIKGAPRSPADLSTNPKHMEGFGRE